MLQTSTLDLALRDTQTRLMALEMPDSDETDLKFTSSDSFNLRSVRIQDIARSGALRFMVSTYDLEDGILRDSDSGPDARWSLLPICSGMEPFRLPKLWNSCCQQDKRNGKTGGDRICRRGQRT